MTKLRAKPHEVNKQKCHIPHLVQVFPYVDNGEINLGFVYILTTHCYDSRIKLSYIEINMSRKQTEISMSNLSIQQSTLYYSPNNYKTKSNMLAKKTKKKGMKTKHTHTITPCLRDAQVPSNAKKYTSKNVINCKG